MEQSINNKIEKAFRLAFKLGDFENDNNIDISKLENDPELDDMIWGHADGLKAQRLFNMRDGRCSLQASMDFDIEAEELQLDKEIKIFQELIDKYL